MTRVTLPNDPSKTYYICVFVTKDCYSCKTYLRRASKVADTLTEKFLPRFEAKGLIADDEEDAKVIYRVIDDVGYWEPNIAEMGGEGEVSKIRPFPQIYLTDLGYRQHGKWEFIVPPLPIDPDSSEETKEKLDEIIIDGVKDILLYGKSGQDKVEEALRNMNPQLEEFDSMWEARQRLMGT